MEMFPSTRCPLLSLLLYTICIYLLMNFGVDLYFQIFSDRYATLNSCGYLHTSLLD